MLMLSGELDSAMAQGQRALANTPAPDTYAERFMLE